MSKSLDLQVWFVSRVIKLEITKDVALAAIWFRENKAHKLSPTESVDRFREWVA